MCGDTRMIKLNYTFTEILGSTFQKKFSPSEVQQMGMFSVHKNLLYHVNEDKKNHTHLNKAYCLMNKNAWKIILRILCRPLLKRRYRASKMSPRKFAIFKTCQLLWILSSGPKEQNIWRGRCNS